MSFRRAWPWAALALVIVGTAAVRARLLDVPLDRDEGEYAWLGALLLDGSPPYARAYHMKMPGTYLVYALALSVFGSTIVAVHLALLLANAVAIALVFLLARRWFDDDVAVAAAVIFAISSLNPGMHGLAAYAEHFVVPVVLLAALALTTALETRRASVFAIAGALFGIAFLVKQSAGPFGALAIGAIGADFWRRRLPARAAGHALASVLVASIVPVIGLGTWLLMAGTFETFWLWTFRYAAEYATMQSPGAAVRMLSSTARDILPGAWPVLGLMLAGAATLVRTNGARVLVALLLAASCAAVSAGFYYRHQYFLLLLPVASLLAGKGALALACLARGTRVRAIVAASLVAAPVAWQLAWQADIFFRATPAAVSREIYGRNPFPESVEIARYIRARTNEHDRIVVFGSEPQIYFYAGRPAATGYVYMYPLMEAHPFAARMQEHMIREVEAARPMYLVYVNLHASWLSTPASNPTLLRWFEQYVGQFERVGVADIVSRDFTRYCWAEAGDDCIPASLIWVAVYRRRE